ncbi:MAG: D-glycero-beta-D-manno-heptose 1-phosphate adenylyltransferase [Nitrospira sp.]|nr:D-glycero-beta-D-manno-heptose 1-phosphate adenylyltransferase [Nitrospira sp.]
MQAKIKTRRELQTLLKKLRIKGKRIVLTNGCFDLLHIGHVRYLEKAKALGNILIVALNSDKSVHLIKGPLRPIIPEKERAEVIAALGCVDYVTLFDEADPGELIVDLRPNVLVKGSDWPKNQIVGKDAVEARGGKVITIPVVPRSSTTKIINSIIKRYGDTRNHSGTTSQRSL